MDPLVWATILLAAGLSLAVIELFIPSGGMIGVLAGLGLVGSVWMGFQHSAWAGLGFAGVSIVAVPSLLSLAFKIWPTTKIGRRVLLTPPSGDAMLPDNDLRRSLKAMLGKTGVAQSLMTPNGAVEIEGQTIDAISEGMVINQGQTVRVVEVHGNRVVVRPSTGAPATQDPLAQSIESLGLDPFDDPLA